MNYYRYRNLIIKSLVFTILYAIATIALAFYRDGTEIMETFANRWYEYLILLFVIIWFNNFFDSKSKKAEKNKFYKEL